MSQHEHEQQEMLAMADRLYSALVQAMKAESTLATKKGVPRETFLQAAVNALLVTTAVFASDMISPESPKSEEARARVGRLQIEFSQAFDRIMQSELRKARGH